MRIPPRARNMRCHAVTLPCSSRTRRSVLVGFPTPFIPVFRSSAKSGPLRLFIDADGSGCDSLGIVEFLNISSAQRSPPFEFIGMLKHATENVGCVGVREVNDGAHLRVHLHIVGGNGGTAQRHRLEGDEPDGPQTRQMVDDRVARAHQVQDGLVGKPLTDDEVRVTPRPPPDARSNFRHGALLTDGSPHRIQDRGRPFHAAIGWKVSKDDGPIPRPRRDGVRKPDWIR